MRTEGEGGKGKWPRAALPKAGTSKKAALPKGAAVMISYDVGVYARRRKMLPLMTKKVIENFGETFRVND